MLRPLGPRPGLPGLHNPFDNDVRIGAAKAEGTDRGNSPPLVLRPRSTLPRDGDRQLVPRDVRIRPGEVQVRRNASVLQCQNHLDQTRDPRSRFQVPHVRLDRSNREGPVFLAVCRVNGRQGGHLDGVSQGGPRPVRLDVADLLRLDVGVGQRSPNQCFLGGAVRCGKTIAVAVVVDRGTANHRQDPVPVLDRIAQPLQHHQAAAFAARIPVGRFVKGLAATVGRESMHRRQSNARRGIEDEVDAPRQGRAALARAQAPNGQMDRDQRR